MKRCNKKRGFTIVELVIVIAVIAILAAVLIPTFSGIIKKSKQSSDQSAVRNMNTILAANATDIEDITDAFDVLEENGISGKNYKALYSNRFFYFDTALKQVVYVNEANKVLYPKDVDSKVANWVSLSGEIAKAEWKDVEIESGVATVATANELYTVMKAIDGGNNKVSNVSKIELTPGATYDLRGADISLDEVTKALEIGSSDATKPATIKGFVRNNAAREGVGSTGTERNYAAGLVATVKKPTTFKNIVIENTIVGSADASQVGAVVGLAQAEVTFENVVIKNTTVKGLQKVGGFVGMINGNAKVTFKDCKTENVTVEATAGMAGGLFGMMFTGNTNVSVVNTNGGYDAETLANNVTVKLVKHANGDYRVVERTETNLLDKTVSIDMNADMTINAEDKIGDGTTYRYFASCSVYGFVYQIKTAKAYDVVGYGGKKVSIAYDAIPAVLVTANQLG